ncbi:hypothetical protein LINGRAHAP2_LOCUS10272 [Linum grandiflorum]
MLSLRQRRRFPTTINRAHCDIFIRTLQSKVKRISMKQKMFMLRSRPTNIERRKYIRNLKKTTTSV